MSSAGGLLPWRRAAAGLAVACAVGAVVLGVRYHDAAGPGRFDRWWAPGSGPADGSAAYRALWAVVTLGDPVVVAVIGLGLAAWSAWRRHWAGALLAVVGPALAAAANDFLFKPVVNRTLGGVLSFPSGHTIAVTSVATVAAILVAARFRRRRRVTLAAVGAVPCAVAAALVTLDLHYLTDTVGGLLAGVAIVLLTGLAIDAVAVRTGARRPTRPGN